VSITYSDEVFGRTAQGAPVRRWTIDDGDVSVGVLDLGGTIQSLHVPGADGERADVVLGFDDVAGYERTKTYAGGLIGRLANRLTGGSFTLDGTTWQTDTNEGPNTVHGGPVGFDRRLWTVTRISTDDGSGLRLALVSEAGDQGFPGRLTVEATYLLVPGEQRMILSFTATTDAPTVVNLTQHSYFNLAGQAAIGGPAGLDGHRLQVFAGHYTPVDGHGLPSNSEEAHVVGTPFDLREPRDVEFLSFDHNFVIDGWDGETLRPAAVLSHAGSGRTLEISTDQPGLQVYTGIGFDGSEAGKGGGRFRPGAALALEAQHLPDSPNQPGYPSVVLRPGETYTSRTEWRFSASAR
jgi:aldose 1-epimerase